METKLNEPIYIDGVPTSNLNLVLRPREQFLFINGVRTKESPGGANYWMMETVLLRYLDEICQSFNGNTDIFADDKSYLPYFIGVNDETVLMIESSGTFFRMFTELGLNDIRDISDRIKRSFELKIIPLLEEVGLYD